MESPSPYDRLHTSLDELERASLENVARSNEIRRRLDVIREGLARGERLSDIVRAQPLPTTVELISTNIEVLQTIGAQLRTAHAQTLRSEGMTIAAIAELYGVTRQRVSALLKQKSAFETPGA